MELEINIPSNVISEDILESDRDNILKYFLSLNFNLISNFLETKGITKTRSRKDLNKKIIEALDNGDITFFDLLKFLESVELYGKQHVILYNGPSSNYIQRFRNENSFMELLGQTNLIDYLDQSLPISFPRELQIASITYSEDKLEIYAVEAHYHLERREDKDIFEVINGQEIEFRAHARNLKRGIVVFRWDLTVNNAILQVMQLPRGYSYEKIEKNFAALLKPLIDLDLFQKLDLSSVITTLHELEESEHPETRSHGLGYKTFGGRSIVAHSASEKDNLLGGEEFIDSALSNIREEDVIGNIGNFYWIPTDETQVDKEVISSEDSEEEDNKNTLIEGSNEDTENEEENNPIRNEIRTVILASKDRINFSTAHTREELEYVLRRVRELSQASS